MGNGECGTRSAECGMRSAECWRGVLRGGGFESGCLRRQPFPQPLSSGEGLWSDAAGCWKALTGKQLGNFWGFLLQEGTDSDRIFGSVAFRPLPVPLQELHNASRNRSARQLCRSLGAFKFVSFGVKLGSDGGCCRGVELRCGCCHTQGSFSSCDRCARSALGWEEQAAAGVDGRDGAGGGGGQVCSARDVDV